jgi:hypothetical protein
MDVLPLLLYLPEIKYLMSYVFCLNRKLWQRESRGWNWVSIQKGTSLRGCCTIQIQNYCMCMIMSTEPEFVNVSGAQNRFQGIDSWAGRRDK